MWAVVEQSKQRSEELATWIQSHEGYNEVSKIIHVFRDDEIRDGVYKYAYIVSLSKSMKYRPLNNGVKPTVYVRRPVVFAAVVHDIEKGRESFQFVDISAEMMMLMIPLNHRLPPKAVCRLCFTAVKFEQDLPFFYATNGEDYLWTDGSVHDSIGNSKRDGQFSSEEQAQAAIGVYEDQFE